MANDPRSVREFRAALAKAREGKVQEASLGVLVAGMEGMLENYAKSQLVDDLGESGEPTPSAGSIVPESMVIRLLLELSKASAKESGGGASVDKAIKKIRKRKEEAERLSRQRQQREAAAK